VAHNLGKLGTCLEEDKVNVVATYLKWNVKLWWRTREKEIVVGFRANLKTKGKDRGGDKGNKKTNKEKWNSSEEDGPK